jgi:hypothetical protein
MDEKYRMTNSFLDDFEDSFTQKVYPGGETLSFGLFCYCVSGGRQEYFCGSLKD